MKKLLAGFVFLSIIVVVINPSELTSLFKQVTALMPAKPEGKSRYEKEDDHINASPEMISTVMKELSAARRGKNEASESPSPEDRFLYVIELHDGGDLEGSSITIEPDLVTVFSQSGIKTVLPRTAIKKINRYKLPDRTKRIH